MNTTAPDPFLDEQKALACVHCGLCLSACPTYLETGNENDSPRGRIYLMRAFHEGRSPLSDDAVRHIDLCLGCRACEVACPSGVQYGGLLEATREHIEQRHERPWFQKFLRRIAIEKIFPFPERLELALVPAKLIRTIRAERFLPKFAREALALLPANSREGTWPELSPGAPVSGPAGSNRDAGPKDGAPMRVGFIRGCVMNVLFGETNEASVRLLNAAGCDVLTPREQGCCGALYAHTGNLEEARACARRNIAAFEPHNLDAIIINAAGCGSTLKEYGHLLQADPAWAKRAANFSAKVKDLSEFLVSSFGFRVKAAKAADGDTALDPKPESRNPQPTVTFHDACHLCHAQRITKPPRELVKEVAGDSFVELPESEICCGSAGSYNLTEPEMAGRLQRRKTENILKTGAQVVVTTNPGCILQMRAGLEKAGAGHIEVVHIADYLSRTS